MSRKMTHLQNAPFVTKTALQTEPKDLKQNVYSFFVNLKYYTSYVYLDLNSIKCER